MNIAQQAIIDPVGDAIAEVAPELLAAKAGHAWPRMLVLAILAGVFIGFGSIVSLVAQSDMGDGGAVQLLAGAAFSVGLMLVMVVGAELFTGNTLMVLPVSTGDLKVRRMIGAWTMVWIGNLVGSVMLALLFWAAGGLSAGVGDAAAALADTKLDKTPLATFCSGVLANVLVCLAVWMAMATKSIVTKLLVILGPVMIFVAAGLEHSVANMSILPLGWLADPSIAPDLGAMLANLVFSTLGNIAGGATLGLAIAYGHATLGRVASANS
ncbi:formate/nitrite transporter family protein [Blastomonas sp. AAP53]|uniref:formate/nitrite transporter family protein n=1 Tax=Blastomonas sp. AAP53 TaxID=1248760 RepID=UPI00030C2628|nr:formate/nitrite transporter family protein [Blastomonas sp. AAP53]